jgi:ABC-type Fe3+/spermidine/putrescine transport system ATPase subunit
VPDSGEVAFAGQDLDGIPAHQRQFGLMFQDFALFPHKDVFANVAFGLRMQRRPAGEIALRVREVLELVQLAGYEQRRVTELSGGEQQRVALARSLAPGPRLLMLDEPLGSLDRTLREQLMKELRGILKGVGLMAIYVTHDQGEAFALADRVMIMRPRLDLGQGGHIEQAGTPQEVYRQPASRFVAQFLGFRNLVDGMIRTLLPAEAIVATELGALHVRGLATPCLPGDRVTALIRPEAASLRSADSAGSNLVAGTVAARSFRGSYYLLETTHGQGLRLAWEISTSGTDVPEPGQAVALQLDAGAITLLPAQ